MVGNFDARIWSAWLTGPPRDLWRNPIPTGQLHQPSPAVLRAYRVRNRRMLARYRRSRLWWDLRAPLRYIGKLGGLTDGGDY